MATTTQTSSRPLVGILFIVAGALALLDLLLAYVAPGAPLRWFGLLTDLALGVAFLLMGLSKAMNILERVAFIVGAVGWLLLALNGLVSIGGLFTVAVVLALVGSLAAGILVWVHSTFTRSTNLWFLIAMIVVAIFLLNVLLPFAAGVIATLLVLLFGAALVIAGFFILRRH
ncbi:MAG: hypothetical protein ABIP33_05490 [Pseudolysinimonas sp.]